MTLTARPSSPSADAPARTGQILLVDDDPLVLESIGELLRFEGHSVAVASTFNEATAALSRRQPDLVLSDVNMPDGNGFELLHQIRQRWPETTTIIMTAFGTIESAVEAMRMGAYHYLTKPIMDDELRLCVTRALEQQALVRENRVLKQRLDDRFGGGAFVSQDHRMLRIMETVEAVADSAVTVLIQGASGTGKTFIANIIHQRSDRRDGPFVEVSCGAIPEALLESELFGHVRGAFTGAVGNKVGKFKAAHRGTIFLDEIATASPALQVKLLRVLQSRQFEPVGSNKTEQVDVRVILATNIDLEQEVRAGRFREDLLYRINVVTIDMPALAERMSDIPILARAFLDRSRASLNRSVSEIDERAMQALQRYHWPGNVRELENIIERAVVLCRGDRITVDDLPPKLFAPVATTGSGPVTIPTTLQAGLDEVEKQIIEAALRANHGNRQATAARLGINRTTLYKKMKRFGMDAGPEETGR